MVVVITIKMHVLKFKYLQCNSPVFCSNVLKEDEVACHVLHGLKCLDVTLLDHIVPVYKRKKLHWKKSFTDEGRATVTVCDRQTLSSCHNQRTALSTRLVVEFVVRKYADCSFLFVRLIWIYQSADGLINSCRLCVDTNSPWNHSQYHRLVVILPLAIFDMSASNFHVWWTVHQYREKKLFLIYTDLSRLNVFL